MSRLAGTEKSLTLIFCFLRNVPSFVQKNTCSIYRALMGFCKGRNMCIVCVSVDKQNDAFLCEKIVFCSGYSEQKSC